jgi:hypothetical protein
MLPTLIQLAKDMGLSGVNNEEEACNLITNNDQELNQEYPFVLSLVDTVGGGGGASSCTVNSTTSTSTTLDPTSCSGGYAKPGWQAGVTGIPTDGKRDLPDVSFFASDGTISDSAYLICVSENGGSPCTYSTDAEPFASEVGGTSASTPPMAGVMALIDQKVGSAQGFANPELYKLAAQQTYSSCSAESVTAGGACLFNDIDTSTNAMPCDYGAVSGKSPDCSASDSLQGSSDEVGILSGFSAAAGYDQATGLGSLKRCQRSQRLAANLWRFGGNRDGNPRTHHPEREPDPRSNRNGGQHANRRRNAHRNSDADSRHLYLISNCALQHRYSFVHCSGR